MNANIMNTQIFHLIKYDLNGHCMSQKFYVWFNLNLRSYGQLLSLFSKRDKTRETNQK